MLKHGSVAGRIPVRDLERARSFYADKLGLEPVEERAGGMRYRCGSGEFALFESAGAASSEWIADGARLSTSAAARLVDH